MISPSGEKKISLEVVSRELSHNQSLSRSPASTFISSRYVCSFLTTQETFARFVSDYNNLKKSSFSIKRQRAERTRFLLLPRGPFFSFLSFFLTAYPSLSLFSSHPQDAPSCCPLCLLGAGDRSSR